ncbi:hypothetical protein ACEWY4_022889 [Coilia grayii]|uniref:Transposase domain-containing protein n=1 Tax=Coilia grayii TaxID=363190 RepID=A0ABD1J4M0_9TELE
MSANLYSERTIKRRAKRRAFEVLRDSSIFDDDTQYLHTEHSHAAVEVDVTDNGFETYFDVAVEVGVTNNAPHSKDEYPEWPIASCPVQCDTSSLSDSDSESDSQTDLMEDLRGWAIGNQVPLCHLNGLLGILKKYHPSLPKDARTLIGTPLHYDIELVAGGTMHYIGIETGIRHVSETYPLPDTINIQINIDGLPLFKSSNQQFWPILGMVEEDPRQQPFVIALYLGTHKPNDCNLFLEKFANEFEKLKSEGVDIFGKHINIQISKFVCDASARAFVKNIKAHNAYHGCEKCTQEGTWIANRMTFPEIDTPLRSDLSFSNQDDEHHHKGSSVLSRIGIGMVSQFPLDYMHLVCLGVMRKLIGLWMRGPLPTRLGMQRIHLISAALLSFAVTLPREFSRKGRMLLEVDRWKATEFRTFLLYTGPVALKEHLSDAMYYNFMLLHVAIRILCSPSLCLQYCDFAENLLKTFVGHFQSVYGNYTVYNVHGLTHLADDARRYGVLQNFSCFPFENFLHTIKKMIRSPTQPLQQVVRRLTEKTNSRQGKKRCTDGFYQEHKDGPHPNDLQFTQYRQFINNGTIISLTGGNNYVLYNGDIFVVRNILKGKDDISYLVCSKFLEKSSFFTYPIDSLNLHILFVKQLEQSSTLIPIQPHKLSKVTLLQYMDGFVAYPLLHTD